MKLGQNKPFLLTIIWIWAYVMYYTTILGLKFFHTCTSPGDSLTELAQMLDFWVQFRLNIPLMLYCGFILSKNIVDVMLLLILCQTNLLVSHCWLKYCLKKLYCDCGITYNPYLHSLPVIYFEALLWCEGYIKSCLSG